MANSNNEVTPLAHNITEQHPEHASSVGSTPQRSSKRRQPKRSTQSTRLASLTSATASSSPTAAAAAAATTTTTMMANMSPASSIPAPPPFSSSRDTYATVVGSLGGAVKRIRTPHTHDVLSGRGGGINSHAGNVQFRAWVADRKNDYNLARNKAEKTLVAREVIALVQGQNPPGRFLQRDPTSSLGASAHGWWVELDDEKIMAKTSQALREGAPQIRAAHKDEIEDSRQQHNNDNNKSKRRSSPERTPFPTRLQAEAPVPAATITPTRIPVVVPDKPRVVAMLQANMEAAKMIGQSNHRDDRPEKRVRVDYKGQTVNPTDETPPLMPLPHPAEIVPLGPELMPEPAVMRNDGGLKRSHSLALSDMSYGEWNNEEFVNPFENENDILESRDPVMLSPIPQHAVMRESSTTSDMGGLGALLKSDPPPLYRPSSFINDINGVRSNRTNNSSSSRSLASILSDLPDAMNSSVAETDFTEGMKAIYNALHSDFEETEPEETTPAAFVYPPFRRPSFRRNSINKFVKEYGERQ